MLHPLPISKDITGVGFPANPQGVVYNHGRIGIKSEDRAEVRLAGLHQAETLIFYRLKGLLVGTHKPCAEILQTQSANEPIAGVAQSQSETE